MVVVQRANKILVSALNSTPIEKALLLARKKVLCVTEKNINRIVFENFSGAGKYIGREFIIRIEIAEVVTLR